jgi:hypothetical protein
MIVIKREQLQNGEYFDILSTEEFLSQTILDPILSDMVIDKENIFNVANSKNPSESKLHMLFIYRPWILLDEKSNTRRIMNIPLLYENGKVKAKLEFLDIGPNYNVVNTPIVLESSFSMDLKSFVKEFSFATGSSGQYVLEFPNAPRDEDLFKIYLNSFQKFYIMQIKNWTFSLSIHEKSQIFNIHLEIY